MKFKFITKHKMNINNFKYLNKTIVFLFLFFIFHTSLRGFIDVGELTFSSEASKKYHLSICAIFKNEAHYLKEWIEYHRLLGIDHFYLYDIGSKDYFEVILKPYIKEGIVTLIPWPEAVKLQDESDAYRWALSTQIPAYENAVNFIARNETEWLIFVDIDEFLVCPKRDIKALLNEYDDYAGISFTSDFFDAATDENLPNKKLLIQSLDLTCPPKRVINKEVSKLIFKPDQCIGFLWPPYQCRFKTPESCIKLDREVLRSNHYMNRQIRNKKKDGLSFRKPKLDIDNRTLNEAMTLEFLEAGYVIEDRDRPIYQLVPDLLKKMGH